jgi:hypothetical protein
MRFFDLTKYYSNKVRIKALYLAKHYSNKVRIKALYLAKHYSNKVRIKALYLIKHGLNLFKWKAKNLIARTSFMLELDSTPPVLDSTDYYRFNTQASRYESESQSLLKVRIAYSILIRERFEYMKDSIESLMNSNLGDFDITIFLIDDGSNDVRIAKYIQSLPSRFSNINIQIRLEKHLNGTAGAVINRAVRLMTDHQNYDLMGWGDPDCIYNNDWLEISLKMLETSLVSKEWQVRFFSSYNSVTELDLHKVLGTIESSEGKILVRQQLGMANVLIRFADLKKIGLFYETPDDETIFIKRMIALGFVGACPFEGLIEHIGEISTLNYARTKSLPRADYSMNLRKSGWPKEIQNYRTYSIEKYLNDKNLTPKSDNLNIDVAFVVHEKDFKTLEIAISSVKLYLEQPVTTIYVISKITPKVQEICHRLDVQLISEDDIFSEAYSFSLESSGGVDRSGWLKQQLIKLSLDSLGGEENILVLDADTILLRPQSVTSNRKNVMQFSQEFHPTYYQTYMRLLGRETSCKISCITHKMVFNKVRLKELKSEIENRHNLTWHKAVYLCSDLTDNSCFSEYELYGHWMLEKYPEELIVNFWSNTALRLNSLKSAIELSEKYGTDFETASFHSYLN